MSLLIVFWGESYRSGGQISRTRGTQNYIERQLIASKSHIDMINKLKYNYEIDVFINTYKLNISDDNNLINFYIENSRKQIFNSKIILNKLNYIFYKYVYEYYFF